MRALVLSDIHGNLHALEAVLGAAQASTGEGFDQLWNLGDVVGYGARPNEVIDILRALATINVRGNHDRVSSGISSSIGFNPIAAAAAWLDPAIITKDRTLYIDVDTTPGPNYGDTLSWSGASKPTRDMPPVHVQLDLDTTRFNNLFVSLMKAAPITP
jgi:hypothetical protein